MTTKENRKYNHKIPLNLGELALLDIALRSHAENVVDETFRNDFLKLRQRLANYQKGES